jgi:hypothetical protein
MKRTKLMAVVTLVTLLILAVGSVSAQSLGDAARAARKNKANTSPTTRHFDNDNLPTNDALSVVGPAPAPAPVANASASAQSKNDKAAVDPAAATLERQKAADDTRKKLDQQKEKIDSLNHEIDLDQREQRLRAAAFYSDAGTRLRNSAQWEKEQSQSVNDASEKQKALDTAKQQYDEMQEQARKAGIAQKDKDPGASSAKDQSKDQK